MLKVGVVKVIESGDTFYRWIAEKNREIIIKQVKTQKTFPKTKGGAKRSFRWWAKRNNETKFEYFFDSDGINVEQLDAFCE